jgi:hypothetical protein
LSFQSCPFERDFNNDGIPDLLVVNQLPSGAGIILVYLGNGDGTFTYNFNGIEAEFEVISNTLITAAVPAQATSGKVEVVTHSGTFSSNVPFRVQN